MCCRNYLRRKVQTKNKSEGAKLLSATSGVLRHRADELGADILAVAPDHLVGAALAGRAAFGENQNEFVEDFVTVDMNAHAFVGNIADKAIARRQPDAELDRGQLAQPLARGAASFLDIERTHDARLHVAAAPWRQLLNI